MKIRIAAAALAISSVAYAQGGGRPTGFLAPGEFDVTAIIGPAPVRGDPRYKADREIFRKTRKLVGSERYALATNDVQTRASAMLGNFSCAVGVRLTPENAPRLSALAARAAIDTGAQAGRGKDFYKRERPYVIDRGKATCQPAKELFDTRQNRASYDYPSGHSTWGWTWALVLASAAPDRAQAILERGRAYADSRFVCGAHNKSATEAGIMVASATMAVVQTKAAYQVELKAVQEELAALRKSGAPAPERCEAERQVIAQQILPPWPKKPRN